MSSSQLQLDSLNPQNLLLMQAYVLRASTAKSASEEYDGWLERIDSLPELSSDQLTLQHGQLIALGFLKFEIAGRSVGLRYQISPRGKQALDRALAIQNSDSSDPDDSEDTCQQEDFELSDAA